jgi:hypothetical protein
MNIILLGNPNVPAEEPVGWIMVHTLVLIAIWLIFCIVMIKRGLRQGREFEQY